MFLGSGHVTTQMRFRLVGAIFIGRNIPRHLPRLEEIRVLLPSRYELEKRQFGGNDACGAKRRCGGSRRFLGESLSPETILLEGREER